MGNVETKKWKMFKAELEMLWGKQSLPRGKQEMWNGKWEMLHGENLNQMNDSICMFFHYLYAKLLIHALDLISHYTYLPPPFLQVKKYANYEQASDQNTYIQHISATLNAINAKLGLVCHGTLRRCTKFAKIDHQGAVSSM